MSDLKADFIETDDILPQLYHLPCNKDKAEIDRLQNIEVNLKIKSGYFSDKLLLVVGLPKSASSTISSCLADFLGVVRKQTAYMKSNADSDLRPEMVKVFMGGGILKTHPQPSVKNFRVIKLLDIKYVITLRHPLDQLTSLLAHHRKVLSQRKDYDFEFLPDDLCLMDREVFAKMNIEEQIDFLINDGYLSAMLTWLVNWLVFRDKDRSMVIRYEDFFSNPEAIFTSFSDFWGAKVASGNKVSASLGYADYYKNLRKDESEYYPRGWTGKVNAWKDYFTDKNKTNYDRFIEKYLAINPNASVLLDYYSDLNHCEDLKA